MLGAESLEEEEERSSDDDRLDVSTRAIFGVEAALLAAPSEA